MKIAKEGVVYISLPALIAVGLLAGGLMFAQPLLWLLAPLFLLLTGFMLYFFRDPRREPPADANVVVSPADGRVTRVSPLAGESSTNGTLVSIFLSPLDVHINRAPIAGRVTSVAYTSGKFLMATNERASLVNEQNALTIEGDRIKVVCKQIAGILARRIICWKKAGDSVALGERFGLIKFSSRTDLILPANVTVTITEGMKVRGGTTIIGRIEG